MFNLRERLCTSLRPDCCNRKRGMVQNGSSSLLIREKVENKKMSAECEWF